LTADVTGTLGTANGGTGNTSGAAAALSTLFTTSYVLFGNGTGLPAYNSGLTYVTGTALTCSSDIVAYSDRREKEYIEQVTGALSKIKKINGYTYKLKESSTSRRHAGVIAQELLDVFPEVVHLNENQTYGVAYGNMAALFIEAIKELECEIQELKKMCKQT
jgi:hypothetical protein